MIAVRRAEVLGKTIYIYEEEDEALEKLQDWEV
jgi:hypothetical protein